MSIRFHSTGEAVEIMEGRHDPLYLIPIRFKDGKIMRVFVEQLAKTDDEHTEVKNELERLYNEDSNELFKIYLQMHNNRL